MPDTADVYTTSVNEWGRWGSEDEIGRANLLDDERVRHAAELIRTGRRFSLALPLCGPHGDPCLPGRDPAEHRMIQHEGLYATGHAEPLTGGMKYADDRLEVACHGTTHMDALGHAYADATIWNGYPADSTESGLPRADIAAFANRGVVGRAVLVDIARHRGVPHLGMHLSVTADDIRAALEHQRTSCQPGDVVILRTGIFQLFYQDAERFYAEFDEPGLEYSPEVVELFTDWQISGLGTDTLCNERLHSSAIGADFALHVLLQRNLGITFHEALWLEEWATDCDADDRYDAFYVAAPLRLVGGSGAPMNPIVIK
jgi:kynurenine formamidase